MTQAAPSPAPSSTQRTKRRAWIALYLVLLAGAVVYSPALRSPFLLDDYLHASMIDGTFPAPRGPFDLYNFVEDADRAVLVDRGMLPWWSHPRLTIRFFRPLSSALLWADHRLFGNRPLPLHMHSLVWWVAAVLAARALFKRAFSPRAAFIATAVFALAPCHALPLAWLANREALVSLTLGTVGLTAYVRWREERASHDGALAALLFGLSVLGGEYGLSFAGYVLAYEIALRGERPRRRALGLLPFVLPVAAYMIARARLHYGTVGSGFYSDPFREPVAFLRLAPRRLATLLAQGWLSLDHETLMPDFPWLALAGIVAACVALLYVPTRRMMDQLDERERQTISWMLLGSVLALAPVLAVVASPRLLGASMLGIAMTVGVMLDQAWYSAVSFERRGAAELTGLVALALGFLHFVHGPMTSFLVGRHFYKSASEFAVNSASFRARVNDPASAEVMAVRGISAVFFLPFAMEPRGAPPARFRVLAQTGHVLALRKGPRTLDIVVPRGQSLFPTGHGNLFRSERARIVTGNVFNVPGLKVTILDHGESGPRSARFEFERNLESAPNVWITEDLSGFVDAPLPEVGFGKPFDP